MQNQFTNKEDINPLGPIAAFAHGQKGKDQDAAGSRVEPNKALQMAIVADGIGQSHNAGEGARWLVKNLINELEPNTSFYKKQVDVTLSLLKEKFKEKLGLPELKPDEVQRYGTTLLLIHETPDTYHIAYLGNGAIFHIRPQQLGLPSNLPWYSVNMLNPHSVFQQGKEALTRYFSPDASDAQVEPTFLTLSKNQHSGDILIACTDGIFSQDSILGGLAANGDIYTRIDANMLALYESLRALAKQPIIDQESLLQMIKDYLAEMHTEGSTRPADDDTALAISITPAAVRYMKEHFGQTNESESLQVELGDKEETKTNNTAAESSDSPES